MAKKKLSRTACQVAHVIVGKCMDHIPLHRTVGRIQRFCGMELAESTVNNWFERGAFWLEALANAIARRIHQNDYIQMDESTLKVMIQPTKGKSSTGHMWVTHAPEIKMVHFHNDKFRNAKVARQLIPQITMGYCRPTAMKLMDGLTKWCTRLMPGAMRTVAENSKLLCPMIKFVLLIHSGFSSSSLQWRHWLANKAFVQGSVFLLEGRSLRRS